MNDLIARLIAPLFLHLSTATLCIIYVIVRTRQSRNITKGSMGYVRGIVSTVDGTNRLRGYRAYTSDVSEEKMYM